MTLNTSLLGVVSYPSAMTW